MQCKISILFIMIMLFIMVSGIQVEGISTAPVEIPPIQRCMISAANSQSAMLTPEGTMLVVGNNEAGMIGNGANVPFTLDAPNYIVLKPYAAMQDVEYLSIQNYSCFAIKKDHTLWSWGFDHCFSLGNGRHAGNCSIPARILDHVKFVATGHALHMLAIGEDGSLWAWGQNDFGQVGNGHKKDVDLPVKVMEGVQFAAVGYGSSAVIKNDGSLWMWGRNDHGELGNGTRKSSSRPIKIMENVKFVSMGFHRCCALKKDGTLWTWGQNDHGEIGDGTRTERHRPVKVLDKVVSISSKASGHHLVIRTDGSVWGWGNNEEGQIGDGTRVDKFKPVKLPALSNVKMVETNEGFSLALKKDGTVWAWGANESGQLGTGDTKSRLRTTKVMDLTKASGDGSCTIPTHYLDGRLNDWNGREPICRDVTGDIPSGQADLESIYGYMDHKYIYLAVKVIGTCSELHVNFDHDGDGKSEYDIEFERDGNRIYVYCNTGDQTSVSEPEFRTYLCDGGVFEMIIPLSAIGNPAKTSISASAFTKGDDTARDEAQQWTALPMRF